MTTISINMKFWHDGREDSTRLRNVRFCWNKLQDLFQYLRYNQIEAAINLYDFSATQYISGSKHIPYPVGTYKKAEKTNIILKEQSNYKFFMMVDSDAFFDYLDYNNILRVIKDLNAGDIVTFDLAKLEDNTESYIIDNEFYKDRANWSYAYSGDRKNGPLNGYSGGLGGIYICDTTLLMDLGGFDEKFSGWGGEDGDMLNRIIYSGKQYRLIPTRHFAPFHLPHFSDWGNSLYSQRFLK